MQTFELDLMCFIMQLKAQKFVYKPKTNPFFPWQDLEDKLQSKRQALEKWRELQSWSRGCTAQLEHLRYQLESSQPLEQLETEVAKLQGELEEWGNTARGTDVLCEQSGTQLTGQSARSTVHELTGKLETLRSVSCWFSSYGTFLHSKDRFQGQYFILILTGVCIY